MFRGLYYPPVQTIFSEIFIPYGASYNDITCAGQAFRSTAGRECSFRATALQEHQRHAPNCKGNASRIKFRIAGVLFQKQEAESLHL